MSLSTSPNLCQSERSQPGFESLEQAAGWYATLRCEDATDEERQAWQAWLAQSPEHAQAWTYIEAVGRRFEPLRGVGPHATTAAVAGVKAAQGRGVNRRQALRGITGLTGLGLAGLLGWRHTGLPEAVMAWGADYRTGTGEQREITLADGSRVWLNTNGALVVDYRAERRLLKLLAGEVLVQTADDAMARPFIVETRFGRMQALGTRFTVRHDSGHTRLDVFEGAVKIHNTAGESRRIDAGHRADFTASRISPVQGAERSRETWHRGVVLAENIPLRQLIDELTRYQPGHIGVAPEVAELSVMGVYPANDPERALAMLENALPVRIRHTLPWWITIEER